MKIIFIALDTLRADHLGCYGYKRSTSLNIDRVAEEGVVFTNAFAPGVPTTPAYTVMYTGLHPLSTGIVSHGAASQILADDVSLLPEVLRKHGYLTAAVDNLYNIKKWFARGYDVYINPPYRQMITADKINEKAIPWIKENKGEDFFLFIHYWDPHTPYIVPEKYRFLYYKGDPFHPNNRSMEPVKKQFVYPFYKKWLYDQLGNPTDIEYVAAQYDSEITYMDEKIGELLQTIKKEEMEEDTLVLIVADHGEILTEHGPQAPFFDHHGLYEGNIHVPLILKWPKRFPPGKRIEALVQHLDIAPTLLEASNISVPENMEGVSLLPLIKGEREEGYQEIHTNECTWRAARAIRTKEWKFVKTIDKGLYDMPPKELFNLREDPTEKHNLINEKARVADELELRMTRWVDKKLENKPDPLRVQAARGLPAKSWLGRVLKEGHLNYEEWTERQKYI